MSLFLKFIFIFILGGVSSFLPYFHFFIAFCILRFGSASTGLCVSVVNGNPRAQVCIPDAIGRATSHDAELVPDSGVRCFLFFFFFFNSSPYVLYTAVFWD